MSPPGPLPCSGWGHWRRAPGAPGGVEGRPRRRAGRPLAPPGGGFIVNINAMIGENPTPYVLALVVIFVGGAYTVKSTRASRPESPLPACTHFADAEAW